MRLSTKRRTSSDDVRKVVLAALATALDDRKDEARRSRASPACGRWRPAP